MVRKSRSTSAWTQLQPSQRGQKRHHDWKPEKQCEPLDASRFAFLRDQACDEQKAVFPGPAAPPLVVSGENGAETFCNDVVPVDAGVPAMPAMYRIDVDDEQLYELDFFGGEAGETMSIGVQKNIDEEGQPTVLELTEIDEWVTGMLGLNVASEDGEPILSNVDKVDGYTERLLDRLGVQVTLFRGYYLVDLQSEALKLESKVGPLWSTTAGGSAVTLFASSCTPMVFTLTCTWMHLYTSCNSSVSSSIGTCSAMVVGEPRMVS